MKYKLKGDVLFLPIKNGVLFKNNKQSLIINGNQDTYQLVDKLIPFLDGNYEVDQLISSLSDRFQKVILDLLHQLYQAEFVQDVTEDHVNCLSVHEQNTYRSHIAFLGHFSNKPIEKFHEYRKSKILACGSGQSLVHLVKSFLESGLQIVEYTVCGSESNDIDKQLESIYMYYKEIDPSIELVKNKSISFKEQELIETFSSYETIAFLSSEMNLDRMKQINYILHKLNKKYIVGVNHNGIYSVGPLTHTSSKRCWECFMHQELLKHVRQDKQLEFATVSSILANTMVHELFQSGIHTNDRKEYAYLIDGFTLKSQQIMIESNHKCSCCSE